jgi:hypothetical protein
MNIMPLEGICLCIFSCSAINNPKLVAVQTRDGATITPLNVVLTFSDNKFSEEYGTFSKGM